MVDGACGGLFFNRSGDEAYIVLENLSEYLMNLAFASNYDRNSSKSGGMFQMRNF